MSATSPYDRLAEVARLFLRLGVTAYGGPAAYIIPRPNSTEMAIHLSYLRAR